MTQQAFTVRGATVLDADGRFAERAVHIADGRFSDAPASSAPGDVNALGLWMIPGVYDCHCHISWSEFHDTDRAALAEQDRAAATAAALRASVQAGVTSMRDAGGADAALSRQLESDPAAGPRLQVAVDMIGAAQAGTPDTMRRHVEKALAKGADWIKLVATAGVATPTDSVLRSHFTQAEIRAAVDTAGQAGARVMMHTWGGESADWAIEHGVASLEHGIHLTDTQLAAAAAAGVALVPTLTIYRLVRDMVVSGELAGVPVERIENAVATHTRVVRPAFEAGVRLCLGSDYGTSRQHGTNLRELAALMRAGLPAAEALLAATANGARLLDDSTGGVIAPDHRADAVLMSADPMDPASFDDPSTVVGVIRDGVIVRDWTSPAPA